MAGVVVGDAWEARTGSDCRQSVCARQPLGEILHLPAESGRAAGPSGVIVGEVAVFLQGRTTAGSVDDDGVQFEPLEDLDVVSGAGPGFGGGFSRRGARAATTLAG